MVLTSHSIASVGNTIDYCLQPIKIAEVIHSDGLDLSGISFDNSTKHNTEALKQDFLMYQNDRLSKPYLSLILSPEIDLDNDKLKAVIDDVLKEMKLDNRQMIAITHTEHRAWEEDTKETKPIKHVHILLNRVDYDNQTYNDKFIGLKGIQAASTVANKHNLRDVYNSRNYEKKIIRKENSDYHKQKSDTAKKLQYIVKPLIYSKSTHSVDDIFHELISEHHVDVEITKFNNGRFGVQLNYEGQSFKASEVSRLLSVVPFEDSYTANKQLQAILDKNMENVDLVGRKTEKEIKDDFLVHKDTKLFMSQLAELTAHMRLDLKTKNNSSTDDQPTLAPNKKKKQLGFKIGV